MKGSDFKSLICCHGPKSHCRGPNFDYRGLQILVKNFVLKQGYHEWLTIGSGKDKPLMGYHKDWRKIAKKVRRKRIRQKEAMKKNHEIKKKEEKMKNNPKYQSWAREQQVRDEYNRKKEAKAAIEARIKWEEDEKAALIQWKRKQEFAKQEAIIREQQQVLIRLEWEKEQEKLQEEKKKKEAEEQKQKEEYEKLQAEMDLFISGELKELPPELNITVESQPGKMTCPFFEKVGACRFQNSCSRNHIRPSISKCILIPGFYSHFSLSSHHQGEYDTDISLEFDHREQYKHFLEFYDDIKEEFMKYGQINVLKVCSNEEAHLRGNVYVEFNEERAAMAAFKGLNGRFYAGKRISVEFVIIPSWNRAICGLQFRRSCPKGKVCNFLHVFRNPHGEFTIYEDKKLSNKDWKWEEEEEEGERNRDKKRKHRHSRSDRSHGRRRDHKERSRSRERRRSRSREYRKRSKRKSSKESKESRRSDEKERNLRNGN